MSSNERWPAKVTMIERGGSALIYLPGVKLSEDEAPSALPGFLTRAPASAPAEAAADGEPAPRRRAPRRKTEAADSEG